MVSSLPTNGFPCSRNGAKATDFTAQTYLRLLYDPAPRLLQKSGGYSSLLIDCGQFSKGLTECWQNSCCADEEGDNGMVSMCFNFFSFGACFAMPLSVLFGLPGLIYMLAVKSQEAPPATFDMMDESDLEL